MQSVGEDVGLPLPWQQAVIMWSLLSCAPAAGAADGFRYFWMTDSCPQTVRDITGKAPFEVLTLAAPIAGALQI
jgi:hypothetical protein